MIQTPDGYAQLEPGDTGSDLVFAAVQGQVLRYVDQGIEKVGAVSPGSVTAVMIRRIGNTAAMDALEFLRAQVVAMFPKWVGGVAEGQAGLLEDPDNDLAHAVAEAEQAVKLDTEVANIKWADRGAKAEKRP